MYKFKLKLFLTLLIIFGASSNIFSKNIILECVPIFEEKTAISSPAQKEKININFSKKIIYFGKDAINYKLTNRIRFFKGTLFNGNKKTFAVDNRLVIKRKSLEASLEKNIWEKGQIKIISETKYQCQKK